MAEKALVPASAPAHAGVEDQHQYLVFNLGGEAYALGLLHVKEIIEYGGLTEVPMMPEVVRGVINLRGAVVPVIDLLVRFGRPPAQVQRRTCVVIVELENGDGHHDVGVIVDAVNEVIEIPAADIEPAPSFGSQIRADFIHGMGKRAGEFVIILDARHTLSMDDIAALAALRREATAEAA